MNATQNTLTRVYTAAADNAASLKDLKGAARRNAELTRSCAIHVERRQ